LINQAPTTAPASAGVNFQQAGIQKKVKAKYEEKYLWIPVFAGMTYRESMINMNKFLFLLLTYFKYFENLTKC